MTDKKSKYGSGMKNTYKQFDDLTIDDSPKDMAMSYYKTHIEHYRTRVVLEYLIIHLS